MKPQYAKLISLIFPAPFIPLEKQNMKEKQRSKMRVKASMTSMEFFPTFRLQNSVLLVKSSRRPC